MSTRKSRRQRDNSRRRGRSPHLGLRRNRLRQWNGIRVSQLLGAYSHDPESLARCVRNFDSSEIRSISEAVCVFEQATPFYNVCKEVYESIPWAAALNLYGVTDNIFSGMSKFHNGHGLHYTHTMTLGIGDVLLQSGMNKNPEIHSQRCKVTISMFTQSPSFRGLAAIHTLDIRDIREEMHVKAQIELGGYTIAETSIVGGCLGQHDLFVSNPEHLASLAQPCGLDTSPNFAHEFSYVVRRLLMTMVGRKWGEPVHDVLSRLLFEQEDGLHYHGEYLGEYFHEHHIEHHHPGHHPEHHSEHHEDHHEDHHDVHHDVYDICDGSGSDSECCEARWYAVEYVSADAKIAQMIFHYAVEPEDIWRSVRYHLPWTEVAELRQAIQILKQGADFYEATRRDRKMRSIPWIDSVVVSKVSVHVEREVKGSHSCDYTCNFKLDNNDCALWIGGTFSKTFASREFRQDWKRSKVQASNNFIATLCINGNTVKPLHGQGRVNEGSILNLVSLNRPFIRAICHEEARMEEFAMQVAHMLWELIKGTTNSNSSFQRLVLLHRQSVSPKSIVKTKQRTGEGKAWPPTRTSKPSDLLSLMQQ
uniref:Uncharacterized protein n=2 Tax=Lotharella globosa TaxID=91324 RepID=A0A7S3Z3U6_9EUKA|mmetsp:Transcript_12648/g.25802  ORF Transcript_12648/g.25802 Transcript_12648/m.25802 type:complete len:589 (+) Transcript_12648:297-2063(+)